MELGSVVVTIFTFMRGKQKGDVHFPTQTPAALIPNQNHRQKPLLS
jgi:hypothetical protein